MRFVLLSIIGIFLVVTVAVLGISSGFQSHVDWEVVAVHEQSQQLTISCSVEQGPVFYVGALEESSNKAKACRIWEPIPDAP